MKKLIMALVLLNTNNLFAQTTPAVGEKIENLTKKIDTLEQKLADVKLGSAKFESPLRLTLGTNFSDLKTVSVNSYYARFSFYKDGINFNKREKKEKIVSSVVDKNENSTVAQIKDYSGFAKKLDLGFYAGMFRQSYLKNIEEINTIKSFGKIVAINKDSFKVQNHNYRKDSSIYTTDQTGFFISPNVLIYNSIKGEKTDNEKIFTVRANVDVEYLFSKQINSFVANKLDTTYNNYAISSLSNINDSISAEPLESNNTVISFYNQLYYGGGYSIYYKQKDVEFLYKYSIGRSKKIGNLLIADDAFNVYSINYFSASHIPSGIRLGGEIRRTKYDESKFNNDRNSNQFLYNIYIAYSIDFAKLVSIFPSRF